MGSPFTALGSWTTFLTQAGLEHKHKYLPKTRPKPQTQTWGQAGSCSEVYNPIALPILFSFNVDLAKACKKGWREERKGCSCSSDRDAAFLLWAFLFQYQRQRVCVCARSPSNSLLNPAKIDYCIRFNDSALLLPLIY